MSYTVTYDDSEEVKGFPTFFEFIPEWMFALNSNFFSVKDGQLYKHYSEGVPRNNFYGVQYTVKVKTTFSEMPSADKIFKNLVIEGNSPWEIEVATNLTESILNSSDFSQRESRYFSPLFGDLTVGDLRGRSAQGIGEIQSSASLVITFSQVPSGVNNGDTLYQINGGLSEIVGVIASQTGTTITVTSIVNAPVNGLVAYAKKPNKYEGGEIRGYYMDVSMENNSTDLVELFSISTNDVKSYV